MRIQILALAVVCSLPGLAQIVVIQGSDSLSSSRTVINNNFSYLDLNRVPISRSISVGTGLTGGGTLSADRTISLAFPAVSTIGGVLSKICDGTDKFSGLGTDGIFICSPDTGTGGGGVWGAITGTLASQTDLNSALTGKAATVHTHAAVDTTSGIFAAARLGGGTANPTTFLRGDLTWAVPSGSGNVVGPGTSTNGKSAVFSGTSGTIIAEETGTGYPKYTNGLPAFSFTIPFADVVGVAPLASPVFTGTPTIPNFTNSTHTHANAAGGGQLGVAAVSATGTPDSTKFWRGDNTWSIPPGGGGTGDVVGPASSTNLKWSRFSGTTGKLIAEETGTGYPKLTSGLPAFSATIPFVDLVGVAATTHAHAAADTTSGVFNVARLASGTPDSTKFARGDGIWAVPVGGSGSAASDLGVVIPTAATGAAIQTAIDSLPSGGTVWLKGNTTYVLGTTGLTVAAVQNNLNIHFETGAIITYAGTGNAITVGGFSAVTYQFTITGPSPYIRLLTGAGTSAHALHMIRMFNSNVHNLRVETEGKGGACTGTARVAIYLDGGNIAAPGGAWSQSQHFYEPVVAGDFKHAFYFGHTFGSLDGNNSNMILGGTAGNTCSDNPAGFVGVYFDVGDNNTVAGIDLDSWTVGLQIEGHANRIISLRTENNNTDWIVGAGVVGNYINGSWTTASDLGTSTSFQSGGNGGVNAAQIVAPTIIGNTKLVGNLGFSGTAGGAVDTTLARLGPASILYAGEMYFQSGFGAPAILARVSGDTTPRWGVTGGGTQFFSSGAATYDTGLTRVSAGLLRVTTGDGTTRATLDSGISYTPSGTIAATSVAGALAELDTEKQPIDADTTAIAALAPADGLIIKRAGGVWTAAADNNSGSGGITITTVGALPGTCTLGTLYYVTDAREDLRLRQCSATNIITIIGGYNGDGSGCFDFVSVPGQVAFIPACLNGSTLTWTGKHVHTPSAAQAITAVGNTITADRVTVQIDPTATFTLTSLPHIAAGADGQILTVCNIDLAFTVTLQDAANLTGSGFRNGGSNLDIGPRKCHDMMYSTSMARWVAKGSATAAGGGDASTNTSTSVANESVRFVDTAGKLLGRSALTGVIKETAGVASVVTGTSTNCVRVDGTSVTCGTGGTETPAPSSIPQTSSSSSQLNPNWISPTQATVGQGHWWLHGVPNAVSTAGAFTANLSRFFETERLSVPMTIGKIVAYVTTASGVATTYAQVGLYDSSCTLIQRSDAITGLNSVGAKSFTFTPALTANPGQYFIGITTDDTAVLFSVVNLSTVPVALLNIDSAAANKRVFTGTASTGAGAAISLPATCGTRSAATLASMLLLAVP